MNDNFFLSGHGLLLVISEGTNNAVHGSGVEACCMIDFELVILDCMVDSC